MVIVGISRYKSHATHLDPIKVIRPLKGSCSHHFLELASFSDTPEPTLPLLLFGTFTEVLEMKIPTTPLWDFKGPK